MDALVMCGGEGTRLAATVPRETPDGTIEKPLYRIGGTPMVDRVLTALDAATRVGTIYAVVSPNAPETRDYLEGRVPLIETPGDGYVDDLDAALTRVDPPALTVAADLPLLAADAVDAAVAVHEGGALSVCVPAALKRELGASADTTFAIDPDAVEFDERLRASDAHAAAADVAVSPEKLADRDDLEVAPTGLNAVADPADRDHAPETMYLTDDVRLAVNVNRARDARIAEALR